MTDMQSQGDVSFVRQEILKAAPPPMRVHGVWPWMRDEPVRQRRRHDPHHRRRARSRCGSSCRCCNGRLFNATWSGDSRRPARPTRRGLLGVREGQFRPLHVRPLSRSGALARQRLLRADGGRHHPAGDPVGALQGLEPALLSTSSSRSSPASCWSAACSACRWSRPSVWGGLFLTLVVSYVGMAMSLPLGILLALGRRSKMPAVHYVCVVFIELCRGVPLITVLFMAGSCCRCSCRPASTSTSCCARCSALSLFAAAYMAEVIRGGLQAIPKGQYEGAKSLGLGYWKMMRLIILPQAITIVIPGIVNTFIGLFKDTSLVYIISIFELLYTVRNSFSDPTWATSTDAGLRPRLRRGGVLDLLLRHEPLFQIHRRPAARRLQTIGSRHDAARSRHRPAGRRQQAEGLRRSRRRHDRRQQMVRRLPRAEGHQPARA